MDVTLLSLTSYEESFPVFKTDLLYMRKVELYLKAPSDSPLRMTAVQEQQWSDFKG